MKKRLSILMTMALLVAVFMTIPAQMVQAKGKVRLTTTKKTMRVGKSYTLTLKNAKNVTWKSSKKSVVTVKKKGKNKAVVRARKAGKSTITASYKGKKYKCVITVKNKQTKKPVEEENPKLNATSIDLYFKSDTYKDLEPQDSQYMNQFQFQVTGTSKEVKIWDLEGEDADYFELTQNGLIKPAGCPDLNTTISVVVKVKLTDGTILKADVRLHALRDILIREKFAEFKNTYITSDMTDEEKINKVAWYAGAFSGYEVGQYSWIELLLRGKGDCMASRWLVANMCNDLGMKAFGCDMNHHGETIVHAGNDYYLVVTGFDAPRPRPYTVTKIETDDIKAYCKEKGVSWAGLQ